MLTFCGWHRIRPEGAKPPRDKAGVDSHTVRGAGSGRAGDGQRAAQGQRAEGWARGWGRAGAARTGQEQAAGAGVGGSALPLGPAPVPTRART